MVQPSLSAASIHACIQSCVHTASM
jgi:hypothetical protein